MSWVEGGAKCSLVQLESRWSQGLRTSRDQRVLFKRKTHLVTAIILKDESSLQKHRYFLFMHIFSVFHVWSLICVTEGTDVTDTCTPVETRDECNQSMKQLRGKTSLRLKAGSATVNYSEKDPYDKMFKAIPPFSPVWTASSRCVLSTLTLTCTLSLAGENTPAPLPEMSWLNQNISKQANDFLWGKLRAFDFSLSHWIQASRQFVESSQVAAHADILTV